MTLGFGKSRAGKSAYGHRDPEEDEKEMNRRNIKRKKTLVDKTSEEIGREFVDAVTDGLSAAMMDPNLKNKLHAFKTNNIMNQLQPEFSTHLDRESKRRYDEG
eukprot:387572_1